MTATPRAQLRANQARFKALLARARFYLGKGEHEAAAAAAQIAAYHATWHHGGLFVSHELEHVLHALAAHALKASHPRERPSRPRAVLHVTSMVAGLAGLQHLLRRWIETDSTRQHGVAVSQPTRSPVPERLAKQVARCGGQIDLVGNSHRELLARAARIRELAQDADLVVLHLQTEDVAPVLALAERAGTARVALVNHADHAFWLGASFADVVVNLRRSGLELCRQRRGIDAERLALLPTPLDEPRRTRSRAQAKRALGLPEDAIAIVSVARATKYEARNGIHFAHAHREFLLAHPKAHLLVVGPSAGGPWAELDALTLGRVRALGPRSDAPLFFEAADIVVDSFPMPSVTSLLEGGSHGAPLVALCEHGSDAATWCSDAPGLDPVMVRCPDLESYRHALDDLVGDAARRCALGQRTVASIRGSHIGSAWVEHIESLYARLGALADKPQPPVGGDQPQQGVVDEVTVTMLDQGDSLDLQVYAHRDSLPLDGFMLRRLARHPALLARACASRLLRRHRRRNLSSG